MSLEDGDSCEVEMNEEKMGAADGEAQTEAVVLKESSGESHPVSAAVGAPESKYVVFLVEHLPVRTNHGRDQFNTYNIDGTLYADFGSSSREARKATLNAVLESDFPVDPHSAKLIE